MPSKILESPFDGRGNPFKFGGGKNDITANNRTGAGYIIDAGGGDDTITVVDFTATGSDDTLTGGTGSDTISGGLGDDIIKGGTDNNTEKFSKKNGASSNDLYGEEIAVIVSTIEDPAGPVRPDTLVAGNDQITGGNGATNNMYGDYLNISVSGIGAMFTGGNDTLTGGDGTADFVADNNMYGDARGVSISEYATYTGGNDTITGGDGADNLIVGDAQIVNISSGGTYVGGNDTLTGGGLDATNTFFFIKNTGHDIITNFNSSSDTVWLKGIVDPNDAGGGYLDAFGDLAALWVKNTSGSMVLDFDGDGEVDTGLNQIVFSGITDASTFLADDFVFV